MFCAFLFGCGEAVVDLDGETSANIIGGSLDAGDSAVVALFAHKANSSSGSLCTATFISQRTLLTAAHCVDPAVVGAGNVFDVVLGSSLNDPKARSIRAASTKFDPAFDINDLGAGHDVALVFLSQAVNVTPLPFNTSASANLVQPGREVALIGFGVNTHSGSGAGDKRKVITSIVATNQLLVQIGNSAQQTCHGDSGGPALLTVKDKSGKIFQLIVGVTSFGQDFSPTQVCFQGGVDTRIDAVSAFITQNLVK